MDNLDIKKQISQNITDLFPEAPGVTSAIENTIRVEPGATLLHKNLMHYLTLAWYNHFSVVISPDMIFYTILCELAEIIKKQPESFRHLFTDSTEKKQILTVANNGRIDLDQVVAGKTKSKSTSGNSTFFLTPVCFSFIQKYSSRCIAIHRRVFNDQWRVSSCDPSCFLRCHVAVLLQRPHQVRNSTH